MNVNELLNELRALANRWAMKARDFARDARDSTNAEQGQYYRGYADGYYKAATELAALLKGETPTENMTASPINTGSRSPAAAPPPPAAYIALPVGEIITMLELAGVSPRDVTFRPGNIVYAVFSRWQPTSEPERVARIKAADLRIVILNHGKLKDTGDPFVEFAFKQG
jgi:hypothetical protein